MTGCRFCDFPEPDACLARDASEHAVLGAVRDSIHVLVPRGGACCMLDSKLTWALHDWPKIGFKQVILPYFTNARNTSPDNVL